MTEIDINIILELAKSLIGLLLLIVVLPFLLLAYSTLVHLITTKEGNKDEDNK